jgi:hypothetical protein
MHLFRLSSGRELQEELSGFSIDDFLTPFPRILEHELSNGLFVWLKLADNPFPHRTSVCVIEVVEVIGSPYLSPVYYYCTSSCRT